MLQWKHPPLIHAFCMGSHTTDNWQVGSNSYDLAVLAEWEVRLMIMHFGVEIWANINVCIHVVKCLKCSCRNGPAVKPQYCHSHSVHAIRVKLACCS